MKFGPVPLAQATGAILAHSIATPAGMLKKGRVLAVIDIAELRAMGYAEVTAARLEAGDVGEDEAARRLAVALAGTGVTVAAPFTGRVNLFAAAAGLATFQADALAAINLVDERLTIATVAPFERVAAGQMLATVKVIPFALPEAIVAACEARARGARLAVAPFGKASAALVLTRLQATKPSVIDKRRRVIADRMAALGADIGVTETVAHETAVVAQALAALAIGPWDPLLVFAASAIIDRDDIVPAALIAAGGRIERLGMPVDPGNLLLLGTLGCKRVIGIPSCAASPKLNGFDWVLERCIAGLDVTAEAVARMGVGGLLKEIPSRPQPREGDAAAAVRRAPAIGALILAAGRSSRMGSNKLVEDLAGEPIVRHVVNAVLASRARPVVVVVGHQAERVRAALAGLDVTIIDNPDYAGGLSTSLRTGLAALPPGINGAFIALGDMPEVGAGHLDRLIAAFAPQDGRAIVVPTRAGKRGNPVLWASAFFAEMAAVAGDTGARHLLGANADAIVEIDLGSDAILTDVDTPEALAAVRARARPGGLTRKE